ncbi:MAG TPA: hypothetical protein VF548_02550 [Allosphingosinicella sp.]|jgi:hypothetical protein
MIRTAIVTLAAVATIPVVAQELKKDKAPPQAKAAVKVGTCEIDRAQVRATYPTLSEFLTTMAYDGAEETFETPKDALQFYLNDKRSRLSQMRRQKASGTRAAMKSFNEERAALRSEIKAFRSAYAKSAECRQAAWWALGANVAAPSYIEATSSALETAEVSEKQPK